MASNLEKLRDFIASTSSPHVVISRSSLISLERELTQLRAAAALNSADTAIAGVCERIRAR